MNKSKIFLILTLSFIGGIFSASFYYPKVVDVFYLAALLILVLIALLIFYDRRNYLIVFAIVFFVSGVWMTSARLEKIIHLGNEKQNFSGEVLISKEPAMQDRMQKIVIQTEDGRKFLVSTSAHSEYAYGDRLQVKCVLEIPPKIENFDYQMYLAKDGITHLCKSPKIEKISNGQGGVVYSFLMTAKENLQTKIERLLPAPQSGLLIGLLLGGDDNVSQAVQEDFSATGLTHIVAVSGYNVTIIAEYLMLCGIFFGLWRKQAFWLAFVGIILFVTMIGLPASAVRAGVMGLLLIWAMKNGRLASAQNAIIFSAGVMLFFNPLLLRWDVGFQLSFLATLGIVYFYPSIEKYSIQKQGLSFFNEILFLTLSAQVFVLPIIMYDFQSLSVISPLANLLVLPVIPLTMLLGFLMLVFSFIFSPLAMVFAWLTFLPLKYEMAMIELMADVKFASLKIANFSWVWVVIWYIIVMGLLYFSKRKPDEEKVPF